LGSREQAAQKQAQVFERAAQILAEIQAQQLQAQQGQGPAPGQLAPGATPAEQALAGGASQTSGLGA